jgi:hypothetical protein
VRFTPAHRLYILGAILLVALALCSRQFGSLGAPSFMLLLAVAAVAYLLAMREFFSTEKFPRRVIVVGLGMAAVWHVLFLAQPPGSDDDVHRYVWDGRVQRLGYNPYVVVPNDPALAGLHTDETRTLNNAYLPSPYPAGAQLFFRAVTAVHESVFAFKVAFVTCAWAIVFLLLDILRRAGQGEHWVLAYAWHPLLAIEVAGSGHIDIVGALLLLVSFAALGRRWRSLAAVAFALAVSVKLLPIVLLPLYWKRIRVRDGALAAAVFALMYVPFIVPMHGRIPVGSLSTYFHSFRFNDPVFAMLERAVSPELAVGIAALVGFLIAMWMRRSSARLERTSTTYEGTGALGQAQGGLSAVQRAQRATSSEMLAETFAWPMAASLLCAPVVYPWYLLWLLPFLRSRSTLPILIWTMSILPTYCIWHLRSLGYSWILPKWIMVLEYGCVAMAAVIVVLRRMRWN